MFARLPDSVSFGDATREITAVSARLATDYPATNLGWEMFPTQLTRMHGQDSHGAFLLMQGAVAFVLLIACANIANILLARGTRRAHEMAVRIALGAGRTRLVRQLLTESLLLALAGGLVGTWLTLWGIRLARGLYEFPEAIDPSLNLLVLAFTASVSAITGVICGLFPALRASRVTPQMTLQSEGARGATSQAARGWLRATLRGGTGRKRRVLATGAGLLVQSLINRQHVDLDSTPLAPCARSRAVRRTIRERRRQRAPPRRCWIGCDATGRQRRRCAGLGARRRSRRPPAILAAWPRQRRRSTGAPNRSASRPVASRMGVPIRQGRVFADARSAGAPLVAIINEEFARQAWPGRNRSATSSGSAPRIRRHRRRRSSASSASMRRSAMHGFVVSRIYVPYAQFPAANLSLVVRARGDVAPAMAAMQTAVRQTDASLVLDAERTVEADVAMFVQPVRFITVLFTAFGVTGVLLAALGVFGTMSYAVSQRQREMAVRAALGADRGDLFRLVLESGLRVTAVGLAGGVVAAIVTARALGSFLFGITPADPGTLAAVAAALAAVSLAACYRPAHIAASVDPMTVLRRE